MSEWSARAAVVESWLVLVDGLVSAAHGLKSLLGEGEHFCYSDLIPYGGVGRLGTRLGRLRRRRSFR
jgi:hypothetical protein